MKKYYSLLDAARFLAAFWVMNFHYLFGNGDSTQVHWYRYGNLGVQIFFIISGFVIVQSLKGKSLKEFIVGRFWRLFPLFWILCTLTYLLTIFLPDVHSVLRFSDYLRSMTMIGDVFDGIVGPAALIDPSYWTLTVELIFYVGVALFVHHFAHHNIRYFLLVWLLVSLCAFLFHIDENFYVKLLLVRHASYFIFGSALSLLVSKDAHRLREKCIDWILLFASAFFATYMHTRAIPAYTISNQHDVNIITVLHISFFLAIPLLVYISAYVTSQRLLHGLAIMGALTYPLYLIHQRIGNMMIDVLTGVAPVSWVTLVICFEVIIIGAAYFLSTWDRWMRDWLQSTQRFNVYPFSKTIAVAIEVPAKPTLTSEIGML